MLKSKKSFYLLFYFIVSLFYMELFFRIAVSIPVNSIGLLIGLVFSVTLAIVYYILCSIFKCRINHVLSVLLLFSTGMIYASQFIYHDFFGTYYNMFSVGNSGQILEFYRDILSRIANKPHLIILFFLPALILMIFGRKILSFVKATGFSRGILAGVIIIVHLAGVSIIHAGDRHQNSPYDLYYNNSYPYLSVEQLGLVTTMRLDLQRLITGWSPNIETSNPYLPEPTVFKPDPTPDEKIDDDIIDEVKPTPEPIEVIEIVYNTLDIDFQSLISSESNENIINMHKYFSSVPPTPRNQYTGKYEGYNLILITAEAFAPYAVHEEVTPTLYKMVNEGYQFTDFYVPLWDVSTSDGEYVGLTSLIPKSGVWSFYRSGRIALPFVMGNQLKDLGYKTVAYHNHTYDYYRRDISHPNMGYDYKGIGNGLVMKRSWPRSDLEMMEITIPEYIEHQPFHAYYMTVSGHLEYNFPGNNMAMKNREYVKHLPYSEQARAYLATQIELDRAMEHLLNQLESYGIADKTLIALSSDHYPYGLDKEVINELAGHEVEQNFELHKNTFVLYTAGMEPKIIDKPSSSLDIIPTLSNLLGLEYDSRLFMGRDLFSDYEPLVVFRNRSFITDMGRYNARSREFIPSPGVEVDENYINRISSIVDSKFYYSTMILDNDYYSIIIDHLNSQLPAT